MPAVRKPPDDRRALIQAEGHVTELVVDKGLRAYLLDRELVLYLSRRVPILHSPGPFSQDCCNYFGVTAALTGAFVPAPEYGDPLSTAPLLVNALTAFEPPFAIHTLPEP